MDKDQLVQLNALLDIFRFNYESEYPIIAEGCLTIRDAVDELIGKACEQEVEEMLQQMERDPEDPSYE